MQTINIIGCGRLGKTLGYLIQQSGSSAIQDICNRSRESSVAAAQFIGAGRPCLIDELAPADIYLITAPDDAIAAICAELVAKHKLQKNSIVLHCSGSLSSGVLKSAQTLGCYIASLHPIKSFADPAKSVKTFTDTFCAFEGSAEAYTVINSLFSAIGGKVFSIEKNQKALYHAAAVFASNYLVTLSHIATQCYEKAGVSSDIVTQIVQQLMTTTLHNLATLPPAKALTGPIARGDIQTISKHLVALQDSLSLSALYKILGQQTLELARINDAAKAELMKLFG